MVHYETHNKETYTIKKHGYSHTNNTFSESDPTVHMQNFITLHTVVLGYKCTYYNFLQIAMLVHITNIPDH